MTGPEIQATYFSTVSVIFYLIAIVFITGLYLQFKWTRHCTDKVKVLVVKPDGGTDTQYAPKTGGYVSLKNPKNGTARMWPINRVCAVEMLYPGDGFIPKFLQKKIKCVIVDEEDWEPILNRGSYSENVASPDVIKRLKLLVEADPDSPKSKALAKLTEGLSAASTRAMIGSPAVLGNIMHEEITKAFVTINKEMFDRVEGLLKRMDKMINPTIVYIGLGGIIIILLYQMFQGQGSEMSDMASDIMKIKNSSGIP